MSIKNLFNWLQGEEELLPVTNTLLTSPIVKQEQSLTLKEQNTLLREIRINKFNGGPVTEKIQELNRQNSYMDYLTFCEQQIAEHSLFLMTLLYLISKLQEEKTQVLPKINQLFMALFQEDAESILSFYTKNRELFKDCHEIQRKVESTLYEKKLEEEVKNVKKNLSDLNQLLSHQLNPLGVVGLFRQCISETEQFSALMLWLLQQGVTTKTILQTHLLHDFLKYHLFTLDDKDNEITHLYNLLSRFPEADDLVEAAKKVASDERGFEQYSLTGVLNKQKLKNSSLHYHSFEFSPSKENFLNLYQLFGLRFLTEAIIWADQHTSPQWIESLRRNLNDPKMPIEHISGLIHFIACEYSSPVLKGLADLIDEVTAQELLSQNEGSALYLLPYKAKLFDAINEKNISALIQKILLNHKAEPEIVYQLVALFKEFSKRKHAGTQLVFQELIDTLIQHPQFLEDDELLKQLKKYPNSKRLLSERYEVIMEKLDYCILEQTAETSFSSRNYQIIEDNWFDASRKFAVLTLIEPQTKFNLGDKYAFQAKIAKVAFMQDQKNFDLNVFIEALSLPDINSTEVSEYERVLIELLVTIDNEVLRKQIIEKLNDFPIQRVDWMQRKYGESTVFIKAAKCGNLGLIKMLEEAISPKSCNYAIVAAANENQWEIVDYLARLEKTLLSEDEIDEILCCAAEEGRVEIIQYLLETYDYIPTPNQLFNLLERAVLNNHLDVVKYFYNSSYDFPKISKINKLFNIAIEAKATDIMSFIANHKKYHPTSSTIESGLATSVLNFDLEVMEKLCHLKRNNPSPISIQKAFIKSCQLGYLPLVEYLYTLPKSIIAEPTLKSGLEQAIIKNHQEIVTYFSSPQRSNRAIIDGGIITAAKAGNLTLTEYLCSLTTSNKPNIDAISKALEQALIHNQINIFKTLCRNPVNPPIKSSLRDSLLLATKKGRQEIIEYLCTKEIIALDQKTIDKAFLLSVKFHQPKILRYLSNISNMAPQQEVTQIAYNKALASKQTEVIVFLKERLQYMKQDKMKMEASPIVSPLINHSFFKPIKEQFTEKDIANTYQYDS